MITVMDWVIEFLHKQKHAISVVFYLLEFPNAKRSRSECIYSFLVNGVPDIKCR